MFCLQDEFFQDLVSFFEVRGYSWFVFLVGFDVFFEVVLNGKCFDFYNLYKEVS